jgi:WD40 repeat protein
VSIIRRTSTGIRFPYRLICSCLFAPLIGAGMLWAQVLPARPDNSNDPAPKMGLLRDVGISADGKLAFAGDSEGTIWVWSVANRKLVRAIQDRSHLKDPCFAFSADGKFAVVGYQHDIQPRADRPKPWGLETLTFWDLTAGVKIRALALQDEPVYAVALSPDGKRALSVSHWKTVEPEPDGRERGIRLDRRFYALKLWDTSNGKLVRTLSYQEVFEPIAFSPTGRFFASPLLGPAPIYPDKQIWYLKKWGTGGGFFGAKSMAAQWPRMEIWCLTVSPDGKQVAVGHYCDVSLWNIDTGKLLWHHITQVVRDGAVIEEGRVGSVAFSPDGKRVVAAGVRRGRGTKGGMVMLDTTTGKKISALVGATEGVASVSFTPDGAMLFGASGEGLRFLDAHTGKTLFTLGN